MRDNSGQIIAGGVLILGDVMVKRIPLSAIQDYESGLSIHAVAKKYGCSGTGVWDLLKRHGIECRGSRNFTDAEEEQIANIYSVGGFSTKAIARAYGLSHHISICAALKRQGVEQRPVPERNRLYTLNPHVFDVIDNEQAAYWWGFLYADATMNKRSLILAIKYSDRDQVEKFKDFMESESPIKECKRSGIYHNAKIEFTDRHLAQQLKKLGVKTGRPNPLKALQYLPKEFIHHWIRGYFDGDGSARKKPSIAFCGSQKLLRWIREILATATNTNPDLAISKHNKANIFYLYIGGRIQALKVANYMYRDATIWMPRKRDVINSWPEPKPLARDGKGKFLPFPS